jgi:hypothetical protein
MWVKDGLKREIGMQAWSANIIAIVIIAYGFLTPEPFHVRVMFALVVGFGVQLAGYLRACGLLQREEILAKVDRNQRELELALDQVKSSHRQAINWQEVTQEMVSKVTVDIQLSRMVDRAWIDVLISLSVLPLYFGQALLGWLLAVAVLNYAPGFAALITTGI